MRADSAPGAAPHDVPLTAKEQAQWMLHRLVPDRAICNIVFAFRTEQPLRWWPLQQSLNWLMYRHPALRAVLRPNGAVPGKAFLPLDEALPLWVTEAREDTLPEVLSGLAAVPFEFDGTPLIRAHLVRLPEGSAVCLVTHHLVSDYLTASVLMREIPALYDAFAGEGQPPPDLARPTALHLEPPADPGDIEYWVRHLDGFDPQRTALTGARPIAGRPRFTGAEISHALSAESIAAAAEIQDRTKVTRNIVLMAAFYLLLARHGAGSDLVVGVPVLARGSAPADVVGFHASTLPVRVRLDPGTSPVELVRRVSTAFLQGLEHGSASFEAVANSLPARSGDWRVPLFRHSFNNRSPNGTNFRAMLPPTMAGGTLAGLDVYHPVSRLDLEWIVWPFPGGVHIAASYSIEVHDKSFVERLLQRYDALLREMAGALDRPLRTVTGWSPADRLAAGALLGPVRPLPAQMLPAQVRATAAARPDAVAVRVRGRDTTYRTLVEMAERVRRELVACGVRPAEPVALYANRGPALAAAVLGVWAAGAAYLPLDPRHPAARLASQLDDAGVRLLLTDGEPDPACLAGRERIGLPDPAGYGPGRRPEQEPPEWPAPDSGSCAYVIYTSGSTGTPKGVEVSHGGLANLVADFARRLAVRPGERTLWLTTFSFDISALELLLPLSTGGTVVVAPDEDRASADRLLGLITDERVDVVQATPTTWRAVGGGLAGRLRGRRVICGGEPLPAALAERLLADGCRLFHVYGPTETTIWSTVAELSGSLSDPLPLGLPVANTTLHILDEDGSAVPPGVPGELCISGAGVALGYRHQPENTARCLPDTATGRRYRTGDRVVLDAGGLAFLGRLDRQVKVRGHRLELTEVEAVLQQRPEVRAAAVATEPDPGGHLRLVAAVVAAPGADADELGRLLRTHARQQLPDAAVPSRFVLVAALPTTGNGKVDHQAVRDLVARAAQPAAPPADPGVRHLVELWREVLDDPSLGPDSDFFLHGGHSLLAMAVAQRATERLGRPVGFEAVFEAPTPAQLHTLLLGAAELALPDGGARR